LTAQEQQLTAQIQKALRANNRQAAPFSKALPKDPPATPGRKSGPNHGPAGIEGVGVPGDELAVQVDASCHGAQAPFHVSTATGIPHLAA
jgi:hypothetical protein